jgi:hypothetical protein
MLRLPDSTAILVDIEFNGVLPRAKNLLSSIAMHHSDTNIERFTLLEVPDQIISEILLAVVHNNSRKARNSYRSDGALDSFINSLMLLRSHCVIALSVRPVY